MTEENLFERDGFTMTTTKMWNGQKLTFVQWEARYVSELEYENEHLKELVSHLRGKLDSERDRYIRLLCKRKEKENG